MRMTTIILCGIKYYESNIDDVELQTMNLEPSFLRFIPTKTIFETQKYKLECKQQDINIILFFEVGDFVIKKKKRKKTDIRYILYS